MEEADPMSRCAYRPFPLSLVLTVAQAAARKKSEPAVVEESSGFSGLPNELYFAAAFTAGALIVGSALSFKEKKRPPTPKGLLYGNPVSSTSPVKLITCRLSPELTLTHVRRSSLVSLDTHSMLTKSDHRPG